MPVGEAPPTHEAAPVPVHESTRFPWPHPMPPSRDLLVAALAALVSMAVVVYLGRELWFSGDAWDLVLTATSATSPACSARTTAISIPLGGHHPGAPLCRGVRVLAVALPARVIGYAAMTYMMWVVLRRRGTDPAIGWIALGGLLFLGPSGFLGSSDIGFFIVLPALALAAAMLDGGGPRGTSDRVVLGGLMVLVVSDAAGVAAVASLAVVAAARRRFRAVLPSVLGAVAVYGGWLLWQEPWSSGVSGLSLETVLRVPEAAWAMLGGAGSQSPGASTELWAGARRGPGRVAGPVGCRGRLTTFDYVWLATAALYVVVVALRTPDPSGSTRWPSPTPSPSPGSWFPLRSRTSGPGKGRRVVVLSVAAVLVIAGSLHALDASLDAAEQTAAEARRQSGPWQGSRRRASGSPARRRARSRHVAARRSWGRGPIGRQAHSRRSGRDALHRVASRRAG